MPKSRKPDAKASPEAGGYFYWSRDPAVGLFAVLPLWLIYILLRSQLAPAERNGAEELLMQQFPKSKAVKALSLCQFRKMLQHLWEHPLSRKGFLETKPKQWELTPGLERLVFRRISLPGRRSGWTVFPKVTCLASSRIT